ncbi:MAG: cytochrome c biogenesis protein ResB, partial [Deltaproteobacteria bacterium]|nr:cytochrome c biogenesis protein ResB [Deltaproteobacteria bacterium]
FRGMGPALQLRIFAPNRSHENILVFQNHPELEAKRPGRYQYRVQDIQPRYYSGLQATKDPGVGLVWVGCLMIITGFSMILFLSHRRVWVRLTASGSNTRVDIGGSSHRNKLGFEKELEKMEDICKGMLPEDKINPQEGPA